MLKIKIKQAKVKTCSHANQTEKVLDMLIAAKALGDLARRFIDDHFKGDARSKVEKCMLHALTTMIMTEDEQLSLDLIAELFVNGEDAQN